MRRFQKKRQTKKLIYSPLSIIVLILLTVFLARSVYRIYGKASLSASSYESALEKLTNLESRKAEIEERLKDLEGEEGIDSELRERYPVIKPGENVIIIIDQERD